MLFCSLNKRLFFSLDRIGSRNDAPSLPRHRRVVEPVCISAGLNNLWDPDSTESAGETGGLRISSAHDQIGPLLADFDAGDGAAVEGEEVCLDAVGEDDPVLRHQRLHDQLLPLFQPPAFRP